MFQVSVSGVCDAVSELNGFVGSHRVLRVDRQLVVEASGAYWAFCSLADFPKASGWTIMGRRLGVAAAGGWDLA